MPFHTSINHQCFEYQRQRCRFAPGCDQQFRFRDTIVFSNGLTGTITLSGSELLITKNLTITGPGASILGVSGNYVYRVFDITNSVTVNISSLAIGSGRVVRQTGIYEG